MSTGMATAAHAKAEHVPTGSEGARGAVVLSGITKYYGEQPAVDDLSLEQMAMRQNSGLFEEVFGMKVLLRRVKA